MSRFSTLGILAAIALSACTQTPAELVNKGNLFFGQGGAGDYASDNYISVTSNGYQEKASVGSVGVSDLKPIQSHALAAPERGKIAFIWPIDGGHIINRFSSKNDGINIAANTGKPIHAAADGTVIYAGNELKDYGNMVIIRHADGYMTAYAHADGIKVKKTDHVKQGDMIASVGKSGGVKEAQLHFGIRSGRQAVDPEQYLPKNVAGL